VLDGFDVTKLNACVIHVHAVLCAFRKIICHASSPIPSQGLADTEHEYGHDRDMSIHTQSDEHVHKHNT